MARPLIIDTETLKVARLGLLEVTPEIREYRRNLIVALAGDGLYTTQGIADLLGIGRRTVFDAIQKVSNPDGRPKGTWGGSRHLNLTPEEEAEFLSRYEDDAISGTILTIPKIREDYIKVTGLVVPPSTIYRMMHRNGWRKVKPDTYHPKGDPELQEEFKKKHSRFRWVKPA